jgi:hypothetical protein
MLLTFDRAVFYLWHILCHNSQIPVKRNPHGEQKEFNLRVTFSGFDAHFARLVARYAESKKPAEFRLSPGVACFLGDF